MPRPLSRPDLLGTSLCWLVVINYAGRQWRWSSQPVTLTDADGDVLQFDGGLAPLELSQVLAVLADSPEMLSISLELYWPEDVASMVADGHDLSAATGELAIIPLDGGRNWTDDRHVLISGRVSQPQYGAAYEAVVFSLEEQPYDDAAVYPPDFHIVKNDTDGTTIEDTSYVFPVVWGDVGRLRSLDGTSNDVRGSKAIVMKRSVGGAAQELMIAGHELASTEATVWAYLQKAEIASFGEVVSYEEWDGRTGVNVSYSYTGNTRTARLDISSLTSAEFNKQSDFYISLESGGLQRLNGTGPITGLGDLAIWWLDQSTIRWDRAKWHLLRQRLNGWLTAGFVNDQVSPWEYVQQNILPLVPVTIHSGPDGLYPVWWDYAATGADAVEHITVAPGIVRQGPVEYDRDVSDVINSFKLEYGYDAGEDAHRGVAVIETGPSRIGAALDTEATDGTEHSTLFAEASVRRYGVSQHETTSTDIIYDEASAVKTLLWWSIAKGFTHRTITYEADQSLLWLQLGDIVKLTDADLSLSAAVGLVRGVTLSDHGRGIIDIQLIDNMVVATLSAGAGGWDPNDDPED